MTNVTEMWYSMDRENCTVYVGKFYRVEWYYDEKGYSQAYDYFLSIPDVQKRKFLILVKKLSDYGKIFDQTKFRNENDGIYEFKPQPDRFLCFFCSDKKIIVTNAFCKKSRKLPVIEKKRAIDCRANYYTRHEEK